MFNFAPLAPAFLPDMVALQNAAFAHNQWSMAEAQQLLASPLYHGLLCFEESVLSGYIFWQALDDEAELLSLAVAPFAQRRGVAKALIEAMQAQLKAQAVQILRLEVADNNAPAIALYERLRFSRVGYRRAYYRTQQGMIDARLYQKSL